MHRKLPDNLRRMPEWDRTQKIIGAFFDVYNLLGYGFPEAVYRRALAVELALRGMTVESEAPVTVFYKKIIVGLLLHFGPDPKFFGSYPHALSSATKGEPDPVIRHLPGHP